jgi:hypothetical protein
MKQAAGEIPTSVDISDDALVQGFTSQVVVTRYLNLENETRGAGGDFVEKVFELLPELTGPFVAQLGERPDPIERTTAASFLLHVLEVDVPAGRKIARRLLHDPEPSVRETTRDVIRFGKHSEALPPELADRLLRS